MLRCVPSFEGLPNREGPKLWQIRGGSAGRAPPKNVKDLGGPAEGLSIKVRDLGVRLDQGLSIKVKFCGSGWPRAGQ